MGLKGFDLGGNDVTDSFLHMGCRRLIPGAYLTDDVDSSACRQKFEFLAAFAFPDGDGKPKLDAFVPVIGFNAELHSLGVVVPLDVDVLDCADELNLISQMFHMFCS